MKNVHVFGLVATLIALTAQSAFAGAPLKCVDVKCRHSASEARYRPGNNKTSTIKSKSATDDWSAQTRNIGSQSSGAGAGKTYNASHSNAVSSINYNSSKSNSGAAINYNASKSNTVSGGMVGAAKVKSHSNTNNN